MGGAPKPPPPLGLAPKVGFTHPLYPTVGKLEPEGVYRSQISTQSPIGTALLSRVGDVQTPYKPQTMSAGDQSRGAFARALTDTSRTALNRAADKFNTEYRQQAEKSRADDVLAQRQNTFDRYRLDTLKDVFDTDVATGYDTRQKDLKAYYEREKKNSQAMVTASILRMVGGLI